MALLKYKDFKKQLSNPSLKVERVKEIEKVEETAEIVTNPLNEASVETLCEIKGIGPKTAEKIKNNGPYEDLDQWQDKAGISDKIAEKIEKSLGLRSC